MSDDDAQDAQGTQDAQGDEAAPRDRAARLEAKAARLREREEARRAKQAAALQQAVAEPPGRRPTMWIALTIVVSIYAVIVSAVGSALVGHYRGESDLRARQLRAARSLEAERATVLHLATQYAVDFGSYNYQTYDADVARVKSHLTGKTLSDYTQASQALRATIMQYQSVEKASVAAAAVQAITPAQATVIVLLDQTVTSKQSPTPRIDRNRLSMVLQRQPDGTWVVPQVTNL